MRRSAPQQQWTQSFKLALPLASSVLLLLVSGCSAPEMGATPMSPEATATASPIDIEQTIARLEPTLLSEISRESLFKPLIAITDPALNQPVTPDNGAPPDPSIAEGEPEKDVLEGVKVNGLIYSPNNRRSMAILQVTGSDATQILQVGQSFVLPDDTDTRIQVNRISKHSVVLAAIGKNGKTLSTKGFEIDNIVGYHSSKKNNNSDGPVSETATQDKAAPPTIGAPDAAAAAAPAATAVN